MQKKKSYFFYLTWLIVSSSSLGCVALALWLHMSATGQASLMAMEQRTAQEVIRYVLRRLEGHNKLEWVAHPVLHTLQRRLEREPPAELPTLGKGQQPSALPSVDGEFNQTLNVDSPEQLSTALRHARPGSRILVAPGVYRLKRKLQVGQAGHQGQPISLSALTPGSVWLEITQSEGLVIDKPHWIIENIGMRGVCKHHDQCEHALHVVGAASYTLIRNNNFVDFNAHVKVNGLRDQWPDHGLLAFNTLTNTRARETAKPVVPLDLVGASHWRVEDNHVSHFVKRDGNRISYGMFMKGGGEGGRFERNLVICSLRDISAPGVRVGLSFGGGGTGGSFCRDGNCKDYEHHAGRASNNIVAHCNDAGIDVNRSMAIDLAHNTVLNTSGIASRGANTQARAYQNLVEGRITARDQSTLDTWGNAGLSSNSNFRQLDALDFQRRNRPGASPRADAITNDFHGVPREAITMPGATQ